MKESIEKVAEPVDRPFKLAFKLPPEEFDKLKARLESGDFEPNEKLKQAAARYRRTCLSK